MMSVVGALKFLVSDRIGLLILFWALVAFGLRPALMAAHQGAAVPLLAGLAADPAGLARLVGAVQWLSMILPVGALAIWHLRLAPTADVRRTFAIPAAYALLLAAGYLAFVWTPVTYLSMITSDSFIFFDAIYRIGQGDVPHADFPTALGAASLYLPWLGSVFAGGYAGSVELISAPLALLIGLACAHAGMRRFPTGVTAGLAALVFLVTVPATLLGLWYGDSHTFIDGQAVVLADNSTYAMFYNRWAWAAILPLLCYLAPRQAPTGETEAERDRSLMIEAAVMAVLLAFLFYLKVTYFMVGGAAAVIYAFMNARPWRTLAIGGGVTLALVVGVGLASGLLLPYLRDLAFVAKINAGKTDTLLTIMAENMTAILLALSPLGVLAALGRFEWRDALIGGFLALASVFLLVQNAQLFDMITLASLAAYGLARVWSGDNRIARLAVAGAFLLTITPPMIDRNLGLIQQTSGARREEVRAPAAWAEIPTMRGVMLAERENMFDGIAAAKTENELIDAFTLSNRMKRKEVARQGEYMAALMAGMDDLKTAMKPGDSIVTLEMANPFPFLMGARTAKGSYLTLDGERTISLSTHPKPEDMFADADHVMIPRQSSRTVDIANRLYDAWLTTHYAERVESLYWVRYSHRKAA